MLRSTPGGVPSPSEVSPCRSRSGNWLIVSGIRLRPVVSVRSCSRGEVRVAAAASVRGAAWRVTRVRTRVPSSGHARGTGRLRRLVPPPVRGDELRRCVRRQIGAAEPVRAANGRSPSAGSGRNGGGVCGPPPGGGRFTAVAGCGGRPLPGLRVSEVARVEQQVPGEVSASRTVLPESAALVSRWFPRCACASTTREAPGVGAGGCVEPQGPRQNIAGVARGRASDGSAAADGGRCPRAVALPGSLM